MRIGVCASPAELSMPAELGYDCMDAHFGRRTGLSNEVFADAAHTMEPHGIPADAARVFSGM